MIRWLFYVFIFCAFLSCNFSKLIKGEKPLAKVYNKYLYYKDIFPEVPPNFNQNDSAIFVENYINQWIEDQLMLYQAKLRLSKKEKDIEHRVEDYHNAILIYKYKQKIIGEKLDTLVTKEELSSYYEKYKDNFIANRTMVRATFVRIPQKGYKSAKIRSLMDKIPNIQAVRDLKELTSSRENHFSPYYYEWVDYERLGKSYPNFEPNKETILRRKYFVVWHNSYYFNIKIHDIVKAGEVIPLELEEKEIKHIILHNRKIEFTKQIRKNIYNEAQRKNAFKIY